MKVIACLAQCIMWHWWVDHAPKYEKTTLRTFKSYGGWGGGGGFEIQLPIKLAIFRHGKGVLTVIEASTSN